LIVGHGHGSKQAHSSQLDRGGAVFLGGLGKRLGCLIESLEPQIPIGRCITFRQDVSLHINHSSAIVSEGGCGDTIRFVATFRTSKAALRRGFILARLCVITKPAGGCAGRAIEKNIGAAAEKQ
jgi:hypothetical protein